MFLVIILVQLYVILVRNGMFYLKIIPSNFLVTIFNYVLDTVYIYSWKKNW